MNFRFNILATIKHKAPYRYMFNLVDKINFQY